MSEYDTALLNYNGVCVYEEDILNTCDNYIANLENPDMIYKAAVFNGLLYNINKYNLHKLLDYRTVENKTLDYNLLDNIFRKLYLPLCYKYNKTPTVNQFSVLCDIDYSNLSDIRNGFYRSNGSKVNNKYSQIVQKWYSICESALYNKAIEESSIGAMFGLKAGYGWRDNTTITVETNQAITHESAEEIAARHAAAVLPEKPVLD